MKNTSYVPISSCEKENDTLAKAMALIVIEGSRIYRFLADAIRRAEQTKLFGSVKVQQKIRARRRQERQLSFKKDWRTAAALHHMLIELVMAQPTEALVDCLAKMSIAHQAKENVVLADILMFMGVNQLNTKVLQYFQRRLQNNDIAHIATGMFSHAINIPVEPRYSLSERLNYKEKVELAMSLMARKKSELDFNRKLVTEILEKLRAETQEISPPEHKVSPPEHSIEFWVEGYDASAREISPAFYLAANKKKWHLQPDIYNTATTQKLSVENETDTFDVLLLDDLGYLNGIAVIMSYIEPTRNFYTMFINSVASAFMYETPSKDCREQEISVEIDPNIQPGQKCQLTFMLQKGICTAKVIPQATSAASTTLSSLPTTPTPVASNTAYMYINTIASAVRAPKKAVHKASEYWSSRYSAGQGACTIL